jgi:hypothetical protein
VKDTYEGRRRRERRRGRRTSASGWLVVLGVVIALSAAVAVPFLITGGRGPEPDLAADPTTRTSTRTSTTPSRSSTGLPVIPAPSATPTPTAAPVTSTAPATNPTTPATQTSTSTPPALFSTTLQAESASLSGCAQVRTVGGASVVDRLGEANDWTGCSSDGVVTFNNVNLPAGTFRITIHYVFGLNDSDPSRLARLRIDPDGPGATVDQQNNYPRTTTCCQTWTTGTFTVAAGTVDISFANPNLATGQDRAPALDRIVIQQQ